MDIIGMMCDDFDESSAENVAELRKPDPIFYPGLQRDSFTGKIEENFGFIIIGMLLAGALVWTILMCG
jgi:hypothetical protein